MHDLQKLEEELKNTNNVQPVEEKPTEEVKEELASEEANNLNAESENQEQETKDNKEESEAAPEESDNEDDEQEEAQQKSARDYKAERLARKKKLEMAESKARELEIKLARLEAERETREKLAQEKQEAKAPEEIPEEGTWEYMEWKINKLEQEQKQAEAMVKATQAEQQWISLDRQWAESNPNYKEASSFLRQNLKDNLKQNFPQASLAEIEYAAKNAEYQLVGNLAKNGIDIASYFIGEAVKSGWSPVSNAKPAVSDKPQTDKKEVAFHKKQSGSLVAAPAGQGSKGIGFRDANRMPLNDLMSLSNDDWQAIANDAAEADRRGLRV